MSTQKRYKIIHCETCGKVIARFDRTKYPKRHVPKEKILEKIRKHYKKHHPRKFKQFQKKALKTKREKGLINKKGGRKMTGKRKKAKKWGKIGAPHSAKRKRWLAKIRRKRRRKRKKK